MTDKTEQWNLDENVWPITEPARPNLIVATVLGTILLALVIVCYAFRFPDRLYNEIKGSL